jgi:acetylornithine deacetylase/succinyl-diaminopimelate desuccinylase-like protein
MRRALPLFVAALLGSTPLAAAGPAKVQTKVDSAQHDQALQLWKDFIAIPTVQGRGNMPQMANHIADLLRKGGFAAEDVIVEGNGDTTTLVARYRGTAKNKGPILLSGHMDVVEAKASDWTRDPFVPVEEKGFVYGRGSLDMKFGDAILVSTLLKLKADGYKPGRDVMLLLSADEETDMATTAALAAKYGKGAELLLNADAGGGLLGADGKPIAFMMQAAEKTYADFEITVTDPGGHSSRPGATNAIYSLAQAIDRIGAYPFAVQSSELTRAYFAATGARTPGALGAAMTKFAADPTDKAAIATLQADPEYVGQVGTTCVATMLAGGHALNALPQRASVYVNCRIFPGVQVEDVKAKLAGAIANPQVTITTLAHPLMSDTSPLRPDVMKAVRKGLDLSHPGLPIVPQMSVGATDSMFFRTIGIPSYGVGAIFLNPDDDFSHGLNERAPTASIDGALLMWRSIIVDLAR